MVAGLDSWQAFQLDVALAVKYSVREKELQASYVETLLAGMENIMRVHGAKVKKRKPKKSLIRPYRTEEEEKAIDDLPLVDDVLRELGASGLTVIKWEGKKEDGR